MSDLKKTKIDNGCKRLHELLAESLDHSPKNEPEKANEALVQIEEGMKRLTTFLGVFKCSIRDGRIHIPWTPDLSTDRLAWQWIACEDADTQKIVLTCEGQEENPDDDGSCVLQQGFCEFAKNGDWIMPLAVLDFLNTNECVWMGCYTFAELMTAEEYDIWHNELKNKLSKISFDELGL